MWSWVTGDASARGARGCAQALGRDIGACGRRGCWIANRSGSPAERFLWRVNHGLRHLRRQIRARGFIGSPCIGLGALRHPGAGQRGRPGFDGGSLQTEAGPPIEARPPIGWRIELRRGTGLRPVERERSGNCGCSRPLKFSSYEKCGEENVQDEHCSDEEPRGERP